MDDYRGSQTGALCILLAYSNRQKINGYMSNYFNIDNGFKTK